MMRLGIITTIFILDRITKHIIINRLKLSESIHITNFFNITYIHNKGIAFGIMNTHASSIGVFLLLIAINLIAIIILIFWLLKPGNNIYMATGISFIIGGAMGNLADRFIYGYVIDFLDFHIGSYHWPAFNIADAAVTIGTVLLGIGFIIKDKNASQSI